jgi:beta-N-acetylhexosaminidase
MTLKEKIGQLFVFGFDGTSPSKGIADLIRNAGVGGVVLFKRNLKSPLQISRLTNALQSFSPKIPLLISIDEEWGRISRLPKGFTFFPSAAAFGVINKSELTYRAAEITAREFRAVGINMDFAPVLDVLTRPENPVIGDRAFGSSPIVVSAMGLAVMAGLQDNGVIACGKHFPGHGDTREDSHLTLPRVTRSLSHLETVELRPFHHLIENGLASIMTAHVLYPALDSKHPATLSARIIGKLLRRALGFQGVVITDDLEMKAIHPDPGEASVLALLAGADLLLICHTEEPQRLALDAVSRAVRSKRISEARIDESVARILALKRRFLMPYQPADPRSVRETVGRLSHRHAVHSILETLQMV